MVIGTQKIHDNTVGTEKISADTILPVDFDQTQSFNFSATNGTWSGVFGVARMQCFSVSDVGNTSTARGYPSGNFSATPLIVAVLKATKGATGQLYATANSASSYTLYCLDQAGAGTNAYVCAMDMT